MVPGGHGACNPTPPATTVPGEMLSTETLRRRDRIETEPPRAPIRVLFCVDNLGIGGTELNAVRTAEALDRARVHLTVALLGADGELRERYERLGIAIHRFPLGTLRGRRTLAEGRRFVKLLRAERIDVVHCHDMYSNVFGSVAGRLAGVPGVIVSRRWSNTLPDPALRAANGIAYRVGHRVLANSDAVATSLKADDGVASRRIAVIPNFVEEAAFERPDADARHAARAALGIEPGDIVIGIVARLAPVKDHATLLRAVATLIPRFPGLRLVLIGDGPERARLEQLAGELGIERRVTFAGTRPHRPNPHHLFEVSVLSSISEGFPNSVVEAMAAERPIVATRVGGTPDAIADGITGILVPPQDPAALGAGLARMLEEPERAREMGIAAGEAARTSYSRSAVLARLLSLYEELTRR
jgi:glycosyltransferase involved in cell wall biosynthesis